MFNARNRRAKAIARQITTPLADAFNKNEIASMAGLGTLLEIPAGTEFVVEGDEGNEAFFIIEGSATVGRGDDVIAMVRAGDMVGEQALITGNLRNASVTSLSPVNALRFDRQEFAWLRLESQTVRSLSDDLIASRA